MVIVVDGKAIRYEKLDIAKESTESFISGLETREPQVDTWTLKFLFLWLEIT